MKALLDTNVLIDFFRDPQKKESFEARADRPRLFMSSIVAMELYAGCKNWRQQSALAAFLKPFEKAGRIVAPDHESLLQAGKVLALLSREGIAGAHLRQMSHDVMIAVTAARAGVVVVTRNVRDFARIEKCAPIRWMTPE
jgi:predicted nucleic acid-binding protein